MKKEVGKESTALGNERRKIKVGRGEERAVKGRERRNRRGKSKEK